MSCVPRISVITFWTVEPWMMKTPALICLCFQALAEALKINASVANIGLGLNQIGDENAKAWCVWWAPLNAAAIWWKMSCPRHPVTVTSLNGLEVLYSFIIHLWSSWVVSKYVDAEWGLFFQVLNQTDSISLSWMWIVRGISVIRFWR